MVTFIAFIASLNLCVGYALGVYFGVCPGLTSRRELYNEEEDNDEVLGLPVSSAEWEPPRAAVTERPVQTPMTSTETTTLERSATTPTAATSTQVASILDGLGDFKAKLAEVSCKLNAMAADREAIDECAGEMKLANTEYLERTAEAIQSLTGADAAIPGTGDGLLRQKLDEQSDEVRRTNLEIDRLASEPDTEQVRQKLMASSDQLTQTAAVLEYTLQAELQSSDHVANRVMGGLDSMMALIDQEISARSDDQPLVVAKLAMNLDAGVTAEDASELLRGIASLVAVELTSGQTMFKDPLGHIALTLGGDNEQTASERCERIRQRVASTTFRNGEVDLTADLMCSVTDTRKASQSNEVVSRLEAGLAKATDYGTGCTVFHSGDSLTIVAPSELSLERQVVEL